jgi:hypothetical protein
MQNSMLERGGIKLFAIRLAEEKYGALIVGAKGAS